MLMDIFSNFDDHNMVVMNYYYLMWWTVFITLTSLVFTLWPRNNYFSSITSMMMSIVEELVVRSMGKNVGGSTAIFSSLLLILVGFNLSGLVPYVFSLTSHLAINLAISLPLWTSIIMMGMMYDMGAFLAHMQPMGSPAALNPFLCLIELVSNMVRPITLAVRLTANLSTGHILMGLLGLGFTSSGMVTTSIILMVGMFYFIFEMGVCMIQGYIFTLLPTLYLDEHPSKDH